MMMVMMMMIAMMMSSKGDQLLEEADSMWCLAADWAVATCPKMLGCCSQAWQVLHQCS
jgi:hypothetical protein